MRLKFPKLNVESRKLKSAEAVARCGAEKAGIALVITLILVSVTAFMAITFLVLSQRERGSVSVIASQTDARLATETALQVATAKLLAPVIAQTNSFAYDLLVSTNYVSPAGFDTTIPANSYRQLTNVNYEYLTGGGALGNPQREQNIANLRYDPRVPVFVTNRVAGSNDFRYYLDLNRNLRYDTNGFLPAVGPGGGFLHPGGGEDNNPVNGLTNLYVGDPEWIGILERPELPHSSSNKFIARYAYIAVPTSRTLDLNYIHNEAKRLDAAMSTQAGFLRNQGVGSWEQNLAAFLVDLNTNEWLSGSAFNYNTNNPGGSSAGVAFFDAMALLKYRYNGTFNNLPTAASVLPGNLFPTDGIDEYSDGPLMQTTAGIDESIPANQDATGGVWPGADNPNRFFTAQELYDKNKTQLGYAPAAFGFTDRLTEAGTNTSSYDRYTYYRLLSQLGTDSTAEQGKINLNYRNVDTNTGAIVPGMQTNFYEWAPITFFTNVANRLLANLTNETAYTNEFGGNAASRALWPTNVSHIVVWTGASNSYSRYTPAVHRMLQLAANICDALTNRNFLFTAGTTNYYAPTIFRPLFRRDVSGDVYIAGYREVVNTDLAILTAAPTNLDLTIAADRNIVPATGTAIANAERDEPIVRGIPLVVGARKGFPNFNSLGLETAIKVTRKLDVFRTSPSAQPNEIRQMYQLGITNVLSVGAWNSYKSAYPQGIWFVGAVDVTCALTNENGVIPANFWPGNQASNRLSLAIYTNFPGGTWNGYDPNFEKKSFRVPLTGYFSSPTNCAWQSASPTSYAGTFVLPLSTNFYQQGLMAPHWWLNVSTRLQLIMLDAGQNRILDYVNLSSDADTLNIMEKLADGTDCSASPGANQSKGGAWCTNMPATYPPYTYIPTYGVINQINMSQHPSAEWQNYFEVGSAGNSATFAQTNFEAFMNGSGGGTNLEMQAPYSPTRVIYQYTSWQVNDPLVHYMTQDLDDLFGSPKKISVDERIGSLFPTNNTAVNLHYRPWGGRPLSGDTDIPTAYHLELKDPMMSTSDKWEFPTNKLPNIGWLGRIHRGTPWQTVYMKSATVDTNTWQKWTGNTDKNDSILAQPQTDWKLFDLFTTAPNDNATRGQLPINQTGLAAWSAALSGVIVINTNAEPVVLGPAGQFPGGYVQTIVEGINNWRTNANFNGITNGGAGWFTNVGGVLAVPELTVSSPLFGGTNGYNYILNNVGALKNTKVTDAVVERIPQQIMSLLRLGDEPRFVIYAYGQSLKPAPGRSIVQRGTYTGLCTNYQITGESAIRAVVRVERAGVNDPKPYQPRIVIESYNNLPPD